MSNALLVNSGIVGFVPSSSRRSTVDVDPDKLRVQVTTEIEAAFRATLQRDRDQQKQRCQQCGVQFDALIQGMKEQISTQVVGLALRLAEIVVRHQLPDRDMLSELIRQTLDPISDLQGARIRMNPSDVQRFQAGDGGLPQIVSDRVEVVPDASLKVGDLMVESKNGIIDARLDQRLSMVAEVLAQRLGGTHAGIGRASP